jgi:hypothetical protein
MKRNKNLLGIIRAKIAMDGVLKKSLARKCRVSQSQFSEMLWGDRPMPEDTLKILLRELELTDTVKKLVLTEPGTVLENLL